MLFILISVKICMKYNHILKILLHILNPISLIIIINEMILDTYPYCNPYAIGIALFSAGITILTYFYHKKWLEISFYSVYTLLFALCFITFPMGIAFALTSGWKLTIMILTLVYLPLLLLIILNIRQLIWVKKKT